MGWAFCCAECATAKYRWRIERRGDAVVTWACTSHLAAVMIDMQRGWERTQLLVTRTHDLETGADLALPDCDAQPSEFMQKEG
jgi:hypothetical protein